MYESTQPQDLPAQIGELVETAKKNLAESEKSEDLLGQIYFQEQANVSLREAEALAVVHERMSNLPKGATR